MRRGHKLPRPQQVLVEALAAKAFFVFLFCLCFPWVFVGFSLVCCCFLYLDLGFSRCFLRFFLVFVDLLLGFLMDFPFHFLSVSLVF